jgi:hypothetical protein
VRVRSVRKKEEGEEEKTNRNPTLLTADRIPIPLLHRPRRDSSNVAPRARFRHAVSAHERLFREATEVFRFLGLRTGDEDGGGGETVGFDGCVGVSRRGKEEGRERGNEGGRQRWKRSIIQTKEGNQRRGEESTMLSG